MNIEHKAHHALLLRKFHVMVNAIKAKPSIMREKLKTLHESVQISVVDKIGNLELTVKKNKL